MQLERKLNRQLQQLRRQVAQHQISKRTALIRGERYINQTHTNVVSFMSKRFKRFGIDKTKPDLEDELEEAIKGWAEIVKAM